MTIEPLATYREARFDGKRQFDLFDHEIRVRGSVGIGMKIDTTIPLRQLQSRVIRIWVRNQNFKSGLNVFAIGFISAIILIEGFSFEFYEFLPGLAGIVALSGLCLMAATAKKVEYARFESDAGVAVLDVARAGPDREMFDEFIEVLQEKINACRDSDDRSD